jgi:hypothetical protein
VAALTGQRVRISGAIPGWAHLARVADGTAVGHVRTEERGDALFIVELVIEEAARGYGLGSEAAALVRGYTEVGPWARLQAWAPPDRGLAVYFWIRMGLRPLHGEGPDGGLLLERDTARGSA